MRTEAIWRIQRKKDGTFIIKRRNLSSDKEIRDYLEKRTKIHNLKKTAKS
jgi:hypothetical protein